MENYILYYYHQYSGIVMNLYKILIHQPYEFIMYVYTYAYIEYVWYVQLIMLHYI